MYAYDAWLPGSDDSYHGGLVRVLPSTDSRVESQTDDEVPGQVLTSRRWPRARIAEAIVNDLRMKSVIRPFDYFLFRGSSEKEKLTLGLGDFIMYSVLSAQAASYGWECAFPAFLGVLWVRP